MATKRIKDLTNTATTVASDEYLAVDGTTNGTSKITRDNFRQDTADAFVAAPGTYNLAPLSGGAVPIDKGGTAATTAAGARTSLDVPSNSEAVLAANNLSDVTAATARTNLSVNSVDEDAEATGTKLVGPALYFDGSNDYLEVSDSSKLSFSSSAEFGTNSSGTWSPDDNTPALTDGTGTLNQHYRIDSGAGTVTQGGSTLSVINGTATTAGQAVYYDGSVWRLKDVDDLPFSVSAWVKMGDATYFNVVSKFGSGNSTREWMATVQQNDDIRLYIQDTSGNYALIQSSDALTGYEGEWVHLAWTYAGAGPNSANAFTAAMDGVSLFVNGESVSLDTATYSGTYTGMSNTSQAVHIGRAYTGYAKGSIRDVKIFNRSLTATEVAQLARGNDLGFADEWGGALGGVYTSDFSNPDVGGNEDLDGFFGTAGTADGNIDSIGGQDDNLRFTVNTALSLHFLGKNSALSLNKWNRLQFEYYIPSSNLVLVGLQVGTDTDTDLIAPRFDATQDAWTQVSYDFLSNSTNLRILTASSIGTTFQDGTGSDVAYFRNIKVTALGKLADFCSERFDSSTGKWYDLSDNAFVGTNTGATLVGREVPVYKSAGTWTPTITFGGGSTGVTYVSQQGYYTRVGDIVFVRGLVQLSSKGTDTGNVEIAGLPYTSTSAGTASSMLQIYAANAVALSSQPLGLVKDNDTAVQLFDADATGQTNLTDTNVGNSSTFRFSGTYLIQ